MAGGWIPAFAQDAATVNLRFISFPKSDEIAEVELYLGEGRTIDVEIPSNDLSKDYRVPAMQEWVVGESTQGEDGKPVFKSYGKVARLSSSKQIILLVRKGKENADGFELVPSADGDSGLSGGQMLFFNAADIRVGGVVGGKKFGIKPKQHMIIEPKAEKNGRLCHASLFYERDGKPKPFFSSKWPVSDYTRGMVFIYHDPETRRLRLHSIRDFLD